MSDSLPIVFNDSGKGVLAARDLGEVGTFCKLIRDAGMVPRGMEKPETMAIAVIAGIERGLTPMQAVNGMCVINNRPTLFGDTMLALCQRTGELEDFTESFDGEGDNLRAICTVKRKGRSNPYIAAWSIKMAKHAGLLGKSGPWQQYPSRMLAARARSQALRAVFADVLCGMYAPEDIDDEPRQPSSPVQAEDQEVIAEYTMPDVDMSGLDPKLAEALVASARAERWDRKRLEAAVDARRAAKPRRRRAEVAPEPEPEPVAAQELSAETTVIDVQAEAADDTLDSLL